jgi:hypothetical protein
METCPCQYLTQDKVENFRGGETMYLFDRNTEQSNYYQIPLHLLKQNMIVLVVLVYQQKQLGSYHLHEFS